MTPGPSIAEYEPPASPKDASRPYIRHPQPRALPRHFSRITSAEHLAQQQALVKAARTLTATYRRPTKRQRFDDEGDILEPGGGWTYAFNTLYRGCLHDLTPSVQPTMAVAAPAAGSSTTRPEGAPVRKHRTPSPGCRTRTGQPSPAAKTEGALDRGDAMAATTFSRRSGPHLPTIIGRRRSSILAGPPYPVAVGIFSLANPHVSSSMEAPLWPNHIQSLAALAAYLQSPRTTSWSGALFDVDFHQPEPLSYRPDITAYMTDDGSPFKAVAFGQVLRRVRFADAHRTFTIHIADDAPADLKKLFQAQIKVLSAPVKDDDFKDIDANLASCGRTGPNVNPCTDAHRISGVGSTIDVHTDHDGTRLCVLHTYPEANGPPILSTPRAAAAAWPLNVGDWVLFEASLHKREDMLGMTPRDYELLARHIRVLEFDPIDELATAAHLKEDQPNPVAGPASPVKLENKDHDLNAAQPSGSILPTVGASPNRPMTRSATKRSASALDDPVESNEQLATPKKKIRVSKSARMSAGEKGPKKQGR
ncbi:hypothetical protein C8R44DRAFT_877237 [Mycena epipterygia]|nr:hypothetical protein C8R44DRAFT_877237 [Mycena epipterygia]